MLYFLQMKFLNCAPLQTDGIKKKRPAQISPIPANNA